MADGSKPGAAMISGLQAYLSGKTIRPMTDKLTVKAPEEVTYSINLTYYINRSDSARAVAIQAAVAQAVEEYKNLAAHHRPRREPVATGRHGHGGRRQACHRDRADVRGGGRHQGGSIDRIGHRDVWRAGR